MSEQNVPSPVKYTTNIAEFCVGRVVIHKNHSDLREEFGPGHVVGFGVNCLNEVTVTVRFAVKFELGEGRLWNVHPNNLELL